MTTIRMNTEAVRDLARQLDLRAMEMDHQRAALRSACARLAWAWQGSTAAHFRHDFNDWLRRFQAQVDQLDQLAMRAAREVDEWEQADRGRRFGGDVLGVNIIKVPEYNWRSYLPKILPKLPWLFPVWPIAILPWLPVLPVPGISWPPIKINLPKLNPPSWFPKMQPGWQPSKPPAAPPSNFHSNSSGSQPPPPVKQIPGAPTSQALEESKYIKFGSKYSSGVYEGVVHPGYDVDGAEGDAIHPIGPGMVVKISNNESGYGHYIVIEHQLENGEKCYSLYAHLKDAPSQNLLGEPVGPETTIGQMGKSGKGSNDIVHLHLEVRTQEGYATWKTYNDLGSDDWQNYWLDPAQVVGNPDYSMVKPM